jgi:ribosomal protein S18 acetylase RimI-like enzyme
MNFEAVRLLKSLKLAVKFRSTANYMATAGNLLIRRASAKDLDFVTHQAIMAGRPIGPYDNPSAFAFNPQGFLMGEVNGKVVACISSITYPNHSSFMGRVLVDKQHRRKGYGQKHIITLIESLDKKIYHWS